MSQTVTPSGEPTQVLSERRPRRPFDFVPVRVFVHLAHGMDARRWKERWRDGTLLGINEPSPYGYHRAESSDVSVEFSSDAIGESRFVTGLRLGLRALLGFDFIHAYRNRHGILSADVVWTHTESQHLAVLALRMLYCTPTGKRPAVIAQTVWLFDSWGRMLSPRRALWRWLMRDANVLTVHSPLNLSRARQIFPESRVELVKFGIRADDLDPPKRLIKKTRLSVLSVGNDRHRDWRTLIEAVRDDPRFQVRIVSRTKSLQWMRTGNNIEVLRIKTNDELERQYDWADVAVVPLKPNLHASGITALQEALVRGVPVVCADTGGIPAYFPEGEIAYFDPGDPVSLREALSQIFEAATDTATMVERAQRRMRNERITSEGFIERHLELTHELLKNSRRLVPRTLSLRNSGS